MVIAERQDDGTYIVRGRNERERITLRIWPCSGVTIRQAAGPNTSRKWLDEVVDTARDIRESRDAGWR